MTPEKLYKRYKEEFCYMCTKDNECNITITNFNGVIEARCTGYKQNDYCMQHKCKGCKYEEKCFGGGNDGREQNR